MNNSNIQRLLDILNQYLFWGALFIIPVLIILYIFMGTRGRRTKRDTGRELLLAVIANSIPVFLFFILSYVAFSGVQQIEEEEQTNELVRQLEPIIQTAVAVGASPTPTRQDYGVKIISPVNGTRVPNSLVVSGSYSVIPPGSQIMLFVVEGADYFPQAYATLNDVQKTWSAGINNLGGTTNQGKEIVAAVVGTEGQALIEYYNEVGQKKGYTPLHKLTSDIALFDRITVIRQ